MKAEREVDDTTFQCSASQEIRVFKSLALRRFLERVSGDGSNTRVTIAFVCLHLTTGIAFCSLGLQIGSSLTSSVFLLNYLQ